MPPQIWENGTVARWSASPELVLGGGNSPHYLLFSRCTHRAPSEEPSLFYCGMLNGNYLDWARSSWLGGVGFSLRIFVSGGPLSEG